MYYDLLTQQLTLQQEAELTKQAFLRGIGKSLLGRTRRMLGDRATQVGQAAANERALAAVNKRFNPERYKSHVARGEHKLTEPLQPRQQIVAKTKYLEQRARRANAVSAGNSPEGLLQRLSKARDQAAAYNTVAKDFEAGGNGFVLRRLQDQEGIINQRANRFYDRLMSTQHRPHAVETLADRVRYTPYPKQPSQYQKEYTQRLRDAWDDNPPDMFRPISMRERRLNAYGYGPGEKPWPPTVNPDNNPYLRTEGLPGILP